MEKYLCEVCQYVYDPELGDEENDIPANTPFEALPEDWACPQCGLPKQDFVLLEE